MGTHVPHREAHAPRAAPTAAPDDRSRASREIPAEPDFSTAVLDTIANLIVVLDAEGKIVRFNRACERATGYMEFEVVGKSVFDLLIPELDLPGVREAFSQLRMGHFPNQHENRWRTRDGAERLFEWANTAIADEHGEVKFVIGTGLDITDRKAVEQRAESLARFPEHSPDPVLRLAGDLRVVYANAAAIAAFQDWGLVPGALAPAPIADPCRLALREAGRVTAEIACGDAVFAAAVVVLGDDEVNVYARDITHRKRAEEALRQSEQRLRSLADSMPQLAWTAQPDGYITWYNRRWYEYTGTTPEQMAGWGWQSVHDPAALPDVMARWKQSIATGMPFEMDFPLRGADGEYRRFLTRGYPLKDQGGNVLQWFGTNTDVTELLVAQEALREADQRKTEFLGVLSHELRNPLAPIRNAIFLLERLPGDSHQAARARQVIRRQTEHLTRLVDDLLDVTRISRGKIQLRREVIDLRNVVRRTCEDHRALFEDAEIDIHLDFPISPVPAEVDPTRITQVIGNLLSNAIKFTPANGSVTVRLRARDDRAHISVSDTGAGMEPEQLARMFEPFAQEDRTLARTKGGLGLGLALSKGLVDLHGGTIAARSDGPGKGAEFEITLPLAVRSQLADASAATIPSAPRLRVLLVDDNLDAARTLADVLELVGHEVTLARDGTTGIALARELKPDVVICDVGLPDVDGYEVARTLRRDEALRSTRLIALSGYAQPEDKARAREAGFDAHLPKPAPIEELTVLLA